MPANLHLARWCAPRRLLVEVCGHFDCSAPKGVLRCVVKDAGYVLVRLVVRAREHQMSGALLDVVCYRCQLSMELAAALVRRGRVDSVGEQRVSELDSAIGADTDHAGFLRRC